ncbi:unnamed protein product [Merluccius merluccius]
MPRRTSSGGYGDSLLAARCGVEEEEEKEEDVMMVVEEEVMEEEMEEEELNRHKAMGDDEWMSRLKTFAASGVWPADAGNRPAPRQKKWFDLFNKDQRWIASTLYHAGKLRPNLKLWYEPPAPSPIYHQAPTPDRFFSHWLMVWMPYHQWRVRVLCPTCGKQLTGYGVHKKVRKVLDIDSFYLLVTEILRCTVCRLTYLSTSQTVRDQLDLPHQRMFHLILTQKDIISRLDHIKATITSTFGSILKMDSSKKITKKLAGIGKGTAFWMTSVGNEIGQILISVLTAEEGAGLDLMVADLMKRYNQACVAPPKGDPEDIALLRRAVTEQLRQEGVRVISDVLVDKRITKKDLAFYCRRRTCGEDTTFRLIDQLLQ